LIHYLTCGFVDLLPRVGACSALIGPSGAGNVTALLPSWKLALGAASKSPRTINSKLDSAKRLEAYLTTEGLPLEPEGIRAFLVAERERTTSASAAKHYRKPARLLPLAADRGLRASRNFA
jgi:hypothetical protein